MEKIFNGKVALVTGAAAGIGRATALSFASRGARVVVADRDSRGSAETARLVRDAGAEALEVEVDVASTKSVAALFDAAVKAFGRVDLACNNAGIEGAQAFTADSSEENFDRVMAVNVKGVWSCMKHEIALMRAQGGGAIVNVSSVAGVVGFPGLPIYVASKHAVNGLTRAAALEYAKENIRVNSVCPAAIQTPMIDRIIGSDPAARKQFEEMHPVGRIGRADEVAEIIAALCSDAAGFVTGVVLPIDGGMTAR